jgi:hypothetical protein
MLLHKITILIVFCRDLVTMNFLFVKRGRYSRSLKLLDAKAANIETSENGQNSEMG